LRDEGFADYFIAERLDSMHQLPKAE